MVPNKQGKSILHSQQHTSAQDGGDGLQAELLVHEIKLLLTGGAVV